MTSPLDPNAGGTALRILITGASGLIGSSLIPHLEKQGHQVLRAVRRPPLTPDEVRWRPLTDAKELPTEELEAFDNLDVVVHLAGENIATGRWSEKKKSRIRSSRIEATRNLVSLLSSTSSPPGTFISSSAIGGYSADGDDGKTEASPLTDSFLGHLCRDWEESSAPLQTSRHTSGTPSDRAGADSCWGSPWKITSHLSLGPWESARLRSPVDELDRSG